MAIPGCSSSIWDVHRHRTNRTFVNMEEEQQRRIAMEEEQQRRIARRTI